MSCTLTPAAAYVHITTNNTIEGTEWKTLPPGVGDVPLVADASSDILSGPIEVSAFRPYLRGRPEESRAVWRDAGHDPRICWSVGRACRRC